MRHTDMHRGRHCWIGLCLGWLQSVFSSGGRTINIRRWFVRRGREPNTERPSDAGLAAVRCNDLLMSVRFLCRTLDHWPPGVSFIKASSDRPVITPFAHTPLTTRRLIRERCEASQSCRVSLLEINGRLINCDISISGQNQSIAGLSTAGRPVS